MPPVPHHCRSDNRGHAALFLALLAIGAGWALTQPLNKLAVSTGHAAIGLIFWQSVIGALVLGALLTLRRRWFRPRPAQWRMALVIALTGTVLPGLASYSAAVHLQAGVLAILLSLVPILSFPMALAFGTETFRAQRLLGLALGLVAVGLILLPQVGTKAPAPVALIWVPVAMIAATLYALEGNIVARFGTAGMGPIQTLFLASLIGAAISAPLAAVTGRFLMPQSFGVAEQALALSSLVHALVYSGYVWLIGRAGPVFAVQISYLVTLFGVIWSMLILGERYGGGVWAALIIMLAGMAMVQPRRPSARSVPLPDVTLSE